MVSRFKKVGGALAAMAPLASFAAEPAADYTTITSAVSWGGVAAGILAIAALVAAPLVVRKGARMILSMLK